MGISGAVQWWEEWQLRVLVLGSLLVQWLLFLSAAHRKHAIPSWFRSIIWLAYLGSDALAIYALAILFGRQRRQDCSSGQGNSILEVVWAPVLLTHLGGQDCITAYNIEDNELWTRHVITAVSQITVAIYVFCKSWPGGDKRLLQAAILFFVPGILKCIEKPWALKSASINSLVSPAPRRTTNRESRINSLEDYVQKARAFVQTNPHRQAQESDGVYLQTDTHVPQAQGEDEAVDLEADHQAGAQGEAAVMDLESDTHPQTSNTWRSVLNQINVKLGSLGNQEREQRSRLDDYNMDLGAYKLFLDLASPYSDRVGILKSFWVLEGKQAYALLQNKLFGAFDVLYTKRKMFILWDERSKVNVSILGLLSSWLRVSALFLPWAAIGLFHNSHSEAYNADDVKVTYALFYCTAVLEFYSISLMRESIAKGQVKFSLGSLVAGLYEQAKTTGLIGSLLSALSNEVLKTSFVGQYTLVGFFARNKRHIKKMCIMNFFNCKDFLDQHWSMKPCDTSFAITELVLKYVKNGWEDQMKDVDSYWKFNDRRGLWTLQANKCEQDLGCSIRRPFDESILLWHIATDFCFYFMGASADHQCATAQCIQDASGDGHGCAVWCERSPHHKRAIRCREMSNYMIYLLFVNPEMLLAGTRRHLFMTANAEVEEILMDEKPSLKKIFKAKKPWLKDILKGEKQWLKDILTEEKQRPKDISRSEDSVTWKVLKGVSKWILRSKGSLCWKVGNGMSKEILKAEREWLEKIERELVQIIISRLQLTECREVAECTEFSPDAEIYPTTQFIQDAWKLAKSSLDLGDDNKMWEVIEGVWVEMLCFSASRSRGYLHAKSLGTGVELLTYVWLLLSCMGMETLPERLQRTELSSGEMNADATPSTSQIYGVQYPTRIRSVMTGQVYGRRRPNRQA
ncbi:uncharacterized protein LOC119302807 [Triticum dicoccoides]|uniref:uncharacterized protein LOC119302807 n=1 Tax=Triticum dicoccoides TaxID=85692 RepID=UPI000E7B6F57|nr:uncharacterized protein LOC119302807 [Triticum dicoccoides]